MQRVLSFVLLTGGVALMVYGVSASNSVGSGISRIVSGAPSDKSLWLMIGGFVAAFVGAVGLIRGSKSL